jgi:hypothetical protein
MGKYDKLMPKSEHRKLMLELAGKHYNTTPVADVTPAPTRPPREKITKSNATLVAEKNTVPVEPEPVKEQIVTKPENIIEVPKPAMSKSVAEMIGQTVNGFQVLSYNESASSDTSKGRALPHVNVICPHCKNEFVANAYNIKGGQKKHCGCLKK